MSELTQCNEYIKTKLMPIVNSCNEHLEGHIFEEDPSIPDIFLDKRRNFIIVCKDKSNALEIGFNAGFSALLILVSNPDIKLTCVDIAIHKYTIPCFNQLKKDFGERIELIVGDSCLTVPKINKTFDLIHIDGGHSLQIAERDMQNTYRLLNNNGIIIMDDVNMNDNNHSLANLWKHYINIFQYKTPDFFIYKNIHQDIMVKSRL